MNRRRFISSLIAVPAAVTVSPNVFATSAPVVEYAMNTTGMYESVTFKWAHVVTTSPFTIDPAEWQSGDLRVK